MVIERQVAPSFSVLNQDNKTVSLADFKASKNVVLYFYSKDDTSGCTVEANQFTQLNSEFAELDTVVLGVSKDDANSHINFINKFDLKVDLLADTEGDLCAAYDVWREKEKNGVKKMGVVRSTFLIDKVGVVRYAEYGVSPDGHAAHILQMVKAL